MGARGPGTHVTEIVNVFVLRQPKGCADVENDTFDFENAVFGIENTVLDVENVAFDMENIVFDIRRPCKH